MIDGLYTPEEAGMILILGTLYGMGIMWSLIGWLSSDSQ